MERPNDKWFRRLGIPALIMLVNLFYLRDYQYNLVTYFSWVAVGVVYLIPVWALVVQWLMFVRRRYHRIRQTHRRIVVTFIGYVLITLVSQLLFTTAIDHSGLAAKPLTIRSYVVNVLVGFFATVLVGAIYEIIYYLRLYRLAVAESQAVQQASLQSQLDSLRSQVNPHFLFNSLNALSALISEDRTRANDFLDELATVYRYLLQTEKQQLVPLKTELTFIRSFLYLFKTRYGAAFTYRIDVDDALLDRLLPPLTLQTLVENATRHNIIEAAKPLCIRIYTQDNALLVSNTLQRRTRLLDTQPGGLDRLISRYLVLHLPPPQIVDDGSLFSVRLPLVAKSVESAVLLKV
ncbi:sensor histidine kinase [Spirosoma sordidisoli]|uniref:Histidine kinase n=1 Tax=Spirosoma sordidisoli TaxID=2502893 RepID=A0A4Q2UKE1_9BACT|nr:sensor histidine kinase [Spirosoma sordidisoli]RYC67269.1 histidine kinase [Spirosoma sordidisoli]